MAPRATTADPFNAIAEPRRRRILDLLATGERPVSELVRRLRVAQPHVSRDLRILREVGLVRARDAGRQRYYRLDPRPLRQVHAWLARYEAAWNARFDALDTVLDDLKTQE